jgi:hypothetical protein
MNGYDFIIGLKNEDRAALLGLSKKEALKIADKSSEELRTCENICLEIMSLPNLKGNCREKLYCCYDCRKEFLENDYECITD